MQKIFIVTALVLVGATSASAQEDPQVITITGGGLVAENVDDTVRITLKGRQFYLSGSPDGLMSGHFFPHPLFCECRPGETYSLGAGWSGNDFYGYFKVGKTTYEFGPLADEDYGYSEVTFSGEWQAPLFDGRTERKVTAAFSFEGLARTPYLDSSGNTTTYLLTGSGRATLFFVWSSIEGRWMLESAKYRFTR